MQIYLVPRPPRKMNIQGISIAILMSAADSGGAFGMIETIVPAGMGPPAHTHSREDETFYVLSGVAEFCVGDTQTVCGSGSCVYGPQSVTHGYRNVGEEELKVLIVYTPGGVEESFQEWSEASDATEVKEIIARYGVTLAL